MRIFIISLLNAILFIGCSPKHAPVGTTTARYDCYSKIHETSVCLGALPAISIAKSNNLPGFNVTGTFYKNRIDRTLPGYYLSIEIYTHGEPNTYVRNGDTLILYMDTENFSFTITNIKQEKTVFGVKECCIGGPFSDHMIDLLQKNKEIRFKVSGYTAEINGIISDQALCEIQKFVTKSNIDNQGTQQ